MKRAELQSYLDSELNIGQFRDYCPNGLQVQGKDEIDSILCAATANLPLCAMAAEQGFDAILCHHGFFWKNEPTELTGSRHRRVKTLMQADINLFAYHLPLDAHPRLGNNVALAEHLGWHIDGFADVDGICNLLCYGRLTQAESAVNMLENMTRLLDRSPVAVGRESKREEKIHRIAWCTGAAQNFLQQAVELGVDAYVSGEISLANTDFARENDILYVSAGHHATERYGIKKLGDHLRERFELRVHYCEQDNPV